jgi:signal peptidase II
MTSRKQVDVAGAAAPRVALRVPAAGLVAAAAVLVLDQLTKWWILDAVMRPPRVIEVSPFFNVVLVWNRGASFGLFGDGGAWAPWALVALAAAIAAGLGVWLWRTKSRFAALALGLVIGGALGNVVDRLRFGAVVDFLDFHLGSQHWPAFNVADSAITVGVVMLLADSLIVRRRNV